MLQCTHQQYHHIKIDDSSAMSERLVSIQKQLIDAAYEINADVDAEINNLVEGGGVDDVAKVRQCDDDDGDCQHVNEDNDDIYKMQKQDTANLLIRKKK